MISIIIPSYNQQDYLVDAIESTLNQTARVDEIIVVDDGSTDNSLEIARKYEPKIKVISQVNKGLASARNTGIMNTHPYDPQVPEGTEYILFLDADDILLPNCIERIYDIERESHADIISPSFKCFGKAQDEVILMPSPTIADFKTGNRVGYCSAIRREALLEIGGYNPKMVWGWEDYDLWFDLLKRGKKMVTIPEVLWLYRTKEVSMITEANKHSDELWAQIKKNHPEIYG